MSSRNCFWLVVIYSPKALKFEYLSIPMLSSPKTEDHSIHYHGGLVTKLCLTFCGPMDCSPPDSSVHGISQARILEWVAISFSRESSPPRDRTGVSCIGRQILYHWAAWEAQVRFLPLCRNWEVSLLSPLMFTFQRDGFQILEEIFLGCKIDKSLF